MSENNSQATVALVALLTQYRDENNSPWFRPSVVHSIYKSILICLRQIFLMDILEDHRHTGEYNVFLKTKIGTLMASGRVFGRACIHHDGFHVL